MARSFATGLVLAALISASTTAYANPTPAKTSSSVALKAKKAPKQQVVAESAVTEKLRAGSLGSFTPSLVDPARSAAIRAQAVERSFRFTPSGKTADRKALTLGLTSRVVAPVAARTTLASASIDGLTPSGYNLGVSVGYQGFSLTGGYSRLESGLIGPGREGVDLGLSYRGNRWKASLQATGELPSHNLAGIDQLMLDKRYAVEVGGAYALSPRLSLQGGMRYQLITPLDPRLTDERQDPSVYLGTSFRF